MHAASLYFARCCVILGISRSLGAASLKVSVAKVARIPKRGGVVPGARFEIESAPVRKLQRCKDPFGNGSDDWQKKASSETEGCSSMGKQFWPGYWTPSHAVVRTRDLLGSWGLSQAL